MPNSFTAAQIEQFKLQAKFLCRSTVVLHSQALDQIASKNGYSNWSLLMKHGTPVQAPAIATGNQIVVPPRQFMFQRTALEMREALRKIPEPRDGNRIEEAERLVVDICKEFKSAKNAVDFAVDYVSCLLTVPRFKLYGTAKPYWEMRFWLPYCVGHNGNNVHILVNRKYKPVGSISTAWANYSQYPHLHTKLSDVEMKTIAHSSVSDGYLYNDGCPPWASREDAENYLMRVRKLQVILK